MINNKDNISERMLNNTLRVVTILPFVKMSTTKGQKEDNTITEISSFLQLRNSISPSSTGEFGNGGELLSNLDSTNIHNKFIECTPEDEIILKLTDNQQDNFLNPNQMSKETLEKIEKLEKAINSPVTPEAVKETMRKVLETLKSEKVEVNEASSATEEKNVTKYNDIKSCLLDDGDDNDDYIYEGKHIHNVETLPKDTWEIAEFYNNGVVLKHVPTSVLADNKPNKNVSFSELKTLFAVGKIEVDGIENGNTKVFNLCIKAIIKCISNIDEIANKQSVISELTSVKNDLEKNIEKANSLESEKSELLNKNSDLEKTSTDKIISMEDAKRIQESETANLKKKLEDLEALNVIRSVIDMLNEDVMRQDMKDLRTSDKEPKVEQIFPKQEGLKYKSGDFVFANRDSRNPLSKTPFVISDFSNGQYYILGDGSHFVSENKLSPATEKDFDEYYTKEGLSKQAIDSYKNIKFDNGGSVNEEKLYYVVGKKKGQLMDVSELPMTKTDCERFIKEQAIEKNYDYNSVDIIPYRGIKPRFKYNKGGAINSIRENIVLKANEILGVDSNFHFISDNEFTIELMSEDEKFDGMALNLFSDGTYEVAEFLAGKNGNDLYIFGNYKSLIPALKSLALGNSSTGRKPIKIEKFENGGSLSSDLDIIYNTIGSKKSIEKIVELNREKVKYIYTPKNNPTYYSLDKYVYDSDEEKWKFISSYGSSNEWDVKHDFKWEMNNMLSLPNYENGGEINTDDKVIITTSLLGEKYKGMQGTINDRKLLDGKYSIKLEDGMEMAFSKDEFRHNSINPRFDNGGEISEVKTYKINNTTGIEDELNKYLHSLKLKDGYSNSMGTFTVKLTQKQFNLLVALIIGIDKNDNVYILNSVNDVVYDSKEARAKRKEMFKELDGVSMSRLKSEFAKEPEIFSGSIVKRGDNEFKIQNGFFYIKKSNSDWEKFRQIK